MVWSGVLTDGSNLERCRSPIWLFGRGLGECWGAVPCRAWGCPACATVKRRILWSRLMRGAIGQSARHALLTFTVRSGWYSPGDYARLMALAWRYWLQRVRRDGVGGCYFRVTELHKSGVPHYHVVMTGGVPHGHLTRLWVLALRWAGRRLGLERVAGHAVPGTVDARWVRGNGASGAVGYVLKYVSKGIDAPLAKALGLRRRWSASVGALCPRRPTQRHLFIVRGARVMGAMTEELLALRGVVLPVGGGGDGQEDSCLDTHSVTLSAQPYLFDVAPLPMPVEPLSRQEVELLRKERARRGS